MLLLGLAGLIWRDEVVRPSYDRFPIEWAEHGELASGFVGKRVLVDGDAGPTFGLRGRDYAIFCHYKGDHPWGPPAMFVRPLSNVLPHNTQHVWVRGTLKDSADGLLLIEEPPPPMPPWLATFRVATITAPVAAVSGVLIWKILAMRKRWMRTRQAWGLCVICGYDLRASKHRCPECGSVISPYREFALLRRTTAPPHI
jgi:hypothetical protein